jgi:CubicO group peptidase (beta-lactamase class C family)
MRHVHFLAASAGTLAAAGVSAQPAPIVPISQCAATLSGREEFAGSVAIARNGEILFSQAYGSAGPDRGPGTPETPHNIGSMSKMFTAVAIGQLVDSGRLRFDDPVGRHLQELPPDIGRVTIAQLLEHSSGLGDFFRIENRETIQSARTARDLLGIAVAGGLQFEPGTRRAYSNSGYVLLGTVIEQLSGQNYADYLQVHILQPAGMTETRLAAPAEAATPMTRLAMRPGETAPEGRRPAPAIGRSSPAGGAYSTAADLVRFAAALMANRLTRPPTTAALLRGSGAAGRPDPRSGETGGYGYGFNLWEVNGVRFAGHGGGTPGVNAELSFNPADGTAVAAVSHYDPPSASQVTAFARRALATPGASIDQTLCGTLAAPPPGMRPARPEAPPSAGSP